MRKVFLMWDFSRLQNLAAARKECSALEDDKERIEHRLHTLQEQSKELQFKVCNNKTHCNR